MPRSSDIIRATVNGIHIVAHVSLAASADVITGAMMRATTIAKRLGYVHRQDAGQRLGNGEQVKEIVAFYPVVFVYDLALDYGYHGPSASESEGSYLEKCGEKLPIYIGSFSLRRYVLIRLLLFQNLSVMGRPLTGRSGQYLWDVVSISPGVILRRSIECHTYTIYASTNGTIIET